VYTFGIILIEAMNQKDYYNILGADKDASQQAIKEAYRKLAFRYHPDRNRGDPAATEKMKDINEAYAVLSNLSKKREYDVLRSQYGSSAYDRFRQRHTADDIFRGSDINQIFEEFAGAFGFRSFSDIFRESYGSEYRGYDFRRPGMFGRGYIFHPWGRERFRKQSAHDSQLRMPGLPFSGIPGKLIRYFLKKLTGIELPEMGKHLHGTVKLSPEKAFDGAEIKYHYKRLGRPKDLMIKIPPNVRDGQWIRLKGMGSPGKAGGEQGDLYLQVKIRRSLEQRLKGFFKI
jgi:DnaJ-class molecular chaperone